MPETMMQFVNVVDYGAVPDDPAKGANNRASIQSALDHAVQEKRPLCFPGGIWHVDFEEGGDDWRLMIKGSVRILGAGRDTTIIIAGPNQPGFAYRCFDIVAGGRVVFNELTIRGPQDPSTPQGDKGENNALTHAVSARRETAGDARSTEICLRDVRLDGAFFCGVYVDNESQEARPPLSVDLSDCDISVYALPLSVFDSNATGLRSRLRARRVDFRSGGLSKETNPGGDKVYGHHIYVHPHVSLEINGCRFADNHRTAINHYSAGGIPPSVRLQHARIVDCVFESTQAQAILCSPNGHTLIRGCVFGSRGGIEVTSTVTITGCEFDGCHNAIRTAGLDADAAQIDPNAAPSQMIRSRRRIHVEGCRFTRIVYGAIDTGAAQLERDSDGKTTGLVLVPLPGAEWVVENCYFEKRVADEHPVIRHEFQAPKNLKMDAGQQLQDSSQARLQIVNCHFDVGTAPESTSNVKPSAAIYGGKRLVLKDSSFEGESDAIKLATNHPQEPLSVTIEQCDFSRLAKTAFVVDDNNADASGTRIAVEGFGNLVNSEQPVPFRFRDSPLRIPGLRSRSGTSLEAVQPTIVSPSHHELRLSYNFDTFRVVGGDFVTHIVVGETQGLRGFAGRICLLAAEEFTLVTALSSAMPNQDGNILLRSGPSPHQFARGAAVALTYDPDMEVPQKPGVKGYWCET